MFILHWFISVLYLHTNYNKKCNFEDIRGTSTAVWLKKITKKGTGSVYPDLTAASIVKSY